MYFIITIQTQRCRHEKREKQKIYNRLLGESDFEPRLRSNRYYRTSFHGI